MYELVAGGRYVATNSYESDADGQAELTPLASGGFLFTWISQGILQGYLLDSSGAATGSVFYLNDESLPGTNASLAPLPSGGFVASWEVPFQGVAVRMFDETGAATTATILLDDGPSLASYQQPTSAGLSDGKFVVAFVDPDDGNSWGIGAQLFDTSGNNVGAMFNVNTATTGAQYNPQAIALDSGGFVISWADNTTKNIAAQFYDASGNTVGSQVTLASGNPSGIFDIAMLASGNFVIVWRNAADELHGQIYDADGTPVGAEFAVNTPSGGAEYLPEIAALASGGFAVAWRSPVGDDPDFFQNGDVHAQIFDANGAKVGDEIVVASGEPGQSEPHIVSFGTDDLFITYVEYDEFGDSTIMYRGLYSAIQGTEGSDVLNGSADRDFIYGNGGNDTLNGGDGEAWDYLNGGDGNDTLNGGTGYSILEGGAGNDQLNLGTNVTPFGPQYQYARGGTGADTINGSDGWDEIYSDVGHDWDDSYSSFNPNFPEFYTPPNLDRGSEVDTINAGDGSDLVSIGYGDSADGGANTEHGDKLFLSLAIAPSGITADFTGMPTLTIGGGTITGFEGVAYLEGSQFNDVFTFDASPIAPGVITEVSALGGDDHVIAGYYTSNIWGGDGNDILDGTHSQYLMYLDGGNGNDTLLGGAKLVGGAGDDTLTGGTWMYGGDGTDTLTGNIGDNILNGGDGADTLEGGAGNDTYEIDAFDTVVENVGEGADTISTASSHTLGANLENLTLTGTAAVNGTGNELDNAITGNIAANVLIGLGGNDTLNGNEGNDIFDGGEGDDFLIGGLGSDTATYAAAASGITLSLGLGGAAQNTGGAGTDRVSSIENLIGSAFNDTLTGSILANVIEGGAGNDTIDGGNGFDTASYASAASAVTVNLALFGGQDTGGAGTDALLNIENLSGSAFNDTLLGNAAANVITGGAGNDIIDGGAGADTMNGGLGDDRFYIDSAFDVLAETAGQGDDSAFVAGTYTLAQGASIETLVALNQSSTDPLILTGNEYGQSLYGNLGDNYLNGGQGNDYLVGLGGNDNLLGGTGADHMAGGTGNDVYYADEAGDLVTELAGEGEDLLVATASYQLAAGVSVETLSAEQTNANINLTGNELAQSLYGNAGDNILTGGGGADYMVGGGGNDKYYVDTSDYIGEANGGGDDWIFVASSYTLREGNEIETLVALNQDSLDQVDFAGNEYGQSLYGSQGVNNLNGGAGNDYLVGLGGNDFLIGGEGNDNMAGGTGNDLYYADSGDQLFENGGEGDDLVVALQSFALGAGQSIETLSAAEGSANISLTGNELAQSLYGNAGANLINGGGGNDYLVGGIGSDRFSFTGAPGNDAIGDFATGIDKIDLSAYGITAAQVSASASGDNTLLSIDSNHDGSADFTITLVGSGTPASGDYIF